MRRKEPVQPKAIAPRFETAGDNRVDAELRGRLAPQVQYERKERLTVASVHAMQFNFLVLWLPAGDNPGR
jgi:hypothetical protein